MEQITKELLSFINNIQTFQNAEVDHCRETLDKPLPLNTVAEFLILKKIGEQNPINAKSLTEKLKITKSAVSKITKRFVQRELIISEKRNGNEKEVFYSLTPKGREVYELQIKAGQKRLNQMDACLDDFTMEERDAINRYLMKINSLYKS